MFLNMASGVNPFSLSRLGWPPILGETSQRKGNRITHSTAKVLYATKPRRAGAFKAQVGSVCNS